MILRKLINAKGFFVTVVAVFILSLAASVYYRGGKDLKVGLFGVEQVLQKKSPYDNPTDRPRPLFRYAPGFAILLYPFLLKSKMVSPFKFENINPSVFAWFFRWDFIIIYECFSTIKSYSFFDEGGGQA